MRAKRAPVGGLVALIADLCVTHTHSRFGSWLAKRQSFGAHFTPASANRLTDARHW